MTYSQCIFSIICNVVIIIGTAAALVHDFFKKGKNGVPARWKVFRFFTILSNVYSAVVSLILLLLEVSALKSGGLQLSPVLAALRFSSAVAVAVTFVTVMVFLGPHGSYRELCLGSGLHMHVIGPLLAVIVFCFAEKTAAFPFYNVIWALIPVILYSILYYYKVVHVGKDKGGWEDFYGFNPDGKWYRAVIAMYAGAFILASVMLLLHNRL